VGKNDFLGNFEPQSGIWMGCKEEASCFASRGSIEEKDGEREKVLAWRGRISLPAESLKEGTITVGPYRYVVVDDRVKRLRGEPAWVERTFEIPLGLRDGTVVCVSDTWQDPSAPPCVLRTAMFTKVVFRDALAALTKARRPNVAVIAPEPVEGTNWVSFRVKNWRLDRGGRVFLVGSSPELGGWDDARALEMALEFGAGEPSRSDPYGTWRVDVCLPADGMGCSYKYIVQDAETGKRVHESGDDRLISGREMKQAEFGKLLIVQEDGHFRHPGHWKGAGVAVPVFSLRSRDSVGCGEFSDLCHLVDFCAQSSLSIIQLLPVNDTSVHDNWMDSYPYSSLSVFALHPMYLSLSGVVKTCGGDKAPGAEADLAAIRVEVEAARRALDLATVDYEGTMRTKGEICEKLFHYQRESCHSDPNFATFLRENAFWLAPYATFCALKKVFGHSDHSNWGSMKNASYALVRRMVTGLREPEGSAGNSESTEDFGALWMDLLELFNPKRTGEPKSDFMVPFKGLIAYSCYVQYHLHRQLKSVVRYAEGQGVALKGDLPIGVDKNSVECWVKRRCFRMEACAGAPPDYYSMQGQNWGFPTYNWEEMGNDNFAWWKQRLGHMANYFHAYRIDHILGFFRIWEVPSSNDESAVNLNTLLPGLLGCFRPAIAITKAELDSKGIWDIDRLCKPYITMDLLEEVFGRLAAPVADFFLFKRHHYYEFKEAFTESNVTFWMDNANWGENFVAYLRADAESNSINLGDVVETVQKGLREILQNVVLLRDLGGEETFHPRFGCLQTHSFKALEPWVQGAISHFHDEYFFRRQDDLWRKNANKILPRLLEESRDMLVCGEDLGLIPQCVPSVMSDLGILGLRIQRMPSESSREGEFGDLSQYPYQVVSLFSSLPFSLSFSSTLGAVFFGAMADECCDDRNNF